MGTGYQCLVGRPVGSEGMCALRGAVCLREGTGRRGKGCGCVLKTRGLTSITAGLIVRGTARDAVGPRARPSLPNSRTDAPVPPSTREATTTPQAWPFGHTPAAAGVPPRVPRKCPCIALPVPSRSRDRTERSRGCKAQSRTPRHCGGPGATGTDGIPAPTHW
jgi:hypothetical protein